MPVHQTPVNLFSWRTSPTQCSTSHSSFHLAGTRYGTLYIFKDYDDLLYITVQLAGGLPRGKAGAGQPLMTLPNAVTDVS